jgi:amino acid transporter
MNNHTGTPVNAVLFDGLFTVLLGLLVFAGSQAINAVFALSIVGLYFAYAIPIAARFVGDNKDVKPGPFSLGMMVSGHVRFFLFWP